MVIIGLEEEGHPKRSACPYQFFLAKIAGSSKLAAIFFVLTKLDEHQNKLKYTHRKTCDPDND